MHEGSVAIIFSVILALFIGNTNMSASKYHKAEAACISLGSHVKEFDATGEAICENNASIDYIVYAREKK